MADWGIERATVDAVSDPAGAGRVQLAPARPGHEGAWAPVATPAAPAAGDEVVVAFEEGDRTRPLVIGALRRDALELRFGGSSVALRADGVVQVEDAQGNAITLQPSGITIAASAAVSVAASQVELTAGSVRVDAGIAKFSGVVQCDTLVANAVVAQSYTPGAGNIA